MTLVSPLSQSSLERAKRKRYLRLEREQLLTSVVIPTDEPLVERPT